MARSSTAVGIATAVLVVGGGSVAATVATGSPNPVIWGQTVTKAVAACKAGLQQGQHGFGDCVSAVAKQKGRQEQKAHPTGAPTDHPTGAPTTAPG